MLKDAAKELGINYSTAKTIIRIWRLENRIHKKYSSTPKKKRSTQCATVDERTRYGHEELLITSCVSIHAPGGRGVPKQNFAKCSPDHFTIEGNNESTTNCSSDMGYINYAMVYYVRTMQRGIEEFQIQQNKLMIRNLLPLCESVFNNFDYYNVLMFSNSEGLKASYYNLLCKDYF
jgi:hypothetical protein